MALLKESLVVLPACKSLALAIVLDIEMKMDRMMTVNNILLIVRFTEKAPLDREDILRYNNIKILRITSIKSGWVILIAIYM